MRLALTPLPILLSIVSTVPAALAGQGISGPLVSGGSTSGSLTPEVAYALEFESPPTSDAVYFVVLRRGLAGWHVNRSDAETGAASTDMHRPRGWLVNAAAHGGREYVYRVNTAADSAWVDGVPLAAKRGTIVLMDGYARDGGKPALVGTVMLPEAAFLRYLRAPHGDKSSVIERELRAIPAIASFLSRR